MKTNCIISGNDTHLLQFSNLLTILSFHIATFMIVACLFNHSQRDEYLGNAYALARRLNRSWHRCE